MSWIYVPCNGPSGGPTARARGVEAHLRHWDPAGRSGGIYNPRRIAGSNAWSVHACGRAIDWFPSSQAVGDMMMRVIADWVGPWWNVQLVLWRQWQYGGRGGPRVVRTNRRDHDDHLHIEVRD